MSPIELELAIEPVGKPRQTRSDKWKQRPCVMVYRAFADQLREACARNGFVFPHQGLSITYRIAMPPSWSQKKRRAMLSQPHQAKPDLDNLTKAVMDALLPDDSVVWSLDKQEKYWAETPSITFSYTKSISPLPKEAQ